LNFPSLMERSLFLFRSRPSIPILWTILFLTWSTWGPSEWKYLTQLDMTMGQLRPQNWSYQCSEHYLTLSWMDPWINFIQPAVNNQYNTKCMSKIPPSPECRGGWVSFWVILDGRRSRPHRGSHTNLIST
jgi:hypothetical protein